ncbi:MAG: 7,8-didemethyl-8-hydroxy-5-deazariboflavin synthase subunit CofH [Pseudonocardiaceae bacterium]|nr:7,8-didemethyl-8-hydroxy-5-deazariboflavin synthase subunit CofH [Pseudonocardiaceae bacterium]
MARAAAVRDASYGSRVTFSPKVFVPLTMLCRDRCGYCTFAHAPRELPAAYLEPDDVLEIARRGAGLGCHEALFTLGERPERRYPAAREWLARRGYPSTVDYLVAACRLVVEETGLLPHANAGALTRDELAALREVTASQGMMIESLRPDLAAHRGAPDKDPRRRRDTLEAAGQLAIPFTTGILVGIGETEADRVQALAAIADAHRRHGHVQEVIVQNFLPKPGTAMREHPACPSEEHLRAIALARLLLPPEVHVQAPPNLSDDPAGLLAAGSDDWGGISPVTVDHVNPERPWPGLDELRAATEAAGHVLAPRLTLHPEFALDPPRWLDEAMRFPVLDRSDAEGLGRDDPGAVLREQSQDAANVGDGAEVSLSGRKSTAWYSGANSAPPTLLPAPARAGGAVAEVLDGVRGGQQPGVDELVRLFGARGPEVPAVAALADELRSVTAGDTVTWVANRNINYTNVCTFRCRFCGFSKGKLSLNLRGAPYLLEHSEIIDRVLAAQHLGATEVCLQGGIHPSFDGEYYLSVCRAIHEAAPGMHIHGFTALEVTEGARRLGEPLAEYLTRLREAGLKTLPGTAAEILDDEVRAVLCPDKVNTEEWLEAHRIAHSVGLRSNVTMMFGAIEQPVHWARHLIRTRDLQRETGGFTEFVGLPFVHMATPMYLKRAARRGPTWREVLLVHAVARIAYRGLIDHVQASWVKLGATGARQLLLAGVDDLGGTLMDENISRAAGASHGQGLDEAGFRAIVEPLGRPLAQRTTLYEPVDPLPVPAV